jgi:hypothetical protein
MTLPENKTPTWTQTRRDDPGPLGDVPHQRTAVGEHDVERTCREFRRQFVQIGDDEAGRDACSRSLGGRVLDRSCPRLARTTRRVGDCRRGRRPRPPRRPGARLIRTPQQRAGTTRSMAPTSTAGTGGITAATPLRVFLSHTSDLGEAGEAGVVRAAAVLRCSAPHRLSPRAAGLAGPAHRGRLDAGGGPLVVDQRRRQTPSSAGRPGSGSIATAGCCSTQWKASCRPAS